MRIDPGWLVPLVNAEPLSLIRAAVVSGSLLVNGLVVLMFFNFVDEQSAVLKYSVWGVCSRLSPYRRAASGSSRRL